MFARLFKRKQNNDHDEILNEGLSLAMEWGKNWLQPIQERLQRAHPELSKDELDDLNDKAQAAMRFDYDLVYASVERDGKAIGDRDFAREVKSRYPWVNEKNVRHMYSPGRYYAWKDFGS
jgi:hypothetical protein